MFKKAGWKISGAIVLVLVIALSIVWNLSNATRFCPLSHKLNPDMSCSVVDSKQDGTLLIEHFNSDTNELKLSIHSNGRITWINHPHGKVKSFKDSLKDNRIKFNPQDDTTLLVNDELFLITPL